MRVVFRVDASLQIGAGHVMRCLTLAEALKLKGAEVDFICRSHGGDLIKLIEQQGFRVCKLPQSITSVELNANNNASGTERESLYGEHWLRATQEQDAKQCRTILDDIKPDWLIVDHYGIDDVWQELLKKSYKKLMVIDDLADRSHLCDLLLDQTYGREKKNYADLVPKRCQMLLGAQYALLRPEFAQWREYSLKRRSTPELKKLLITMGGVDLDNITEEVLAALKESNLPEDVEIIVVMGVTAPHIESVKKQAKLIPNKTVIKVNVANMAEIMANADLAIGAAGATTWERCCLGLPSFVVVLSDNQNEVACLLSEQSASKVIKKGHLNEMLACIGSFSNEMLLKLSRNSANVLDGQGIGRVMRELQA